MQNFQPKFFYHLYSHKIFFWLFIAFFLLQIFFWKETESTKAHFDIVPPSPNKYVISAASLGDQEFLFRVLAARLQNSGDIFAGFVALSKYDYNRIYQWLTTLDTLNNKSNFTPALAAYYYGQTQNYADTKYIVNYLDEHYERDPNKNWWWLLQAIYLAKNKMQNMDRALDLAYKLSQNKEENAPLWTRQMPAFLHEEMGDGCMAFKIIEKILKESESGVKQIKPEDIDFMRHFIKERLTKLQERKFDPRKCKEL
jgi:hypothetical protein